MAFFRTKNGLFGIIILVTFITYYYHTLEIGTSSTHEDKHKKMKANDISGREKEQKKKKTKNEERRALRSSGRVRKNVLFLMADDMRAQIGPYDGPDSEYSKPKLHTPNFDSLAAKSLLLKKAFVQYTLCGPSRTSMLTSRRPDITGIYTNRNHWRYERGNYTTLPQYFKLNGYTVQGIGKVFHPGRSSGNDDPLSWTEPYKHGMKTEYEYLKPFGRGERWLAVSPEEEKDKPLPDRSALQLAKEFLEEAAPKARSGEKFFFLGLGFNKPHVSLICPKEYYDLYPEETEEQFLAEPLWQTPYFRNGSGIINGTALNNSWNILPTETLRHLRQGYFACISYVDELLGEVLNTLDVLNLTDNTIVSFVADHGYHLGEQRMVGKQTLYDSSSHVPMMLHIPGRTDHGIVSESIVLGLDVFPTIVEAAGLDPIHPCRSNPVDIPLCTEGVSILPLIENPDIKLRSFAITQQLEDSTTMRFSIRDKRYRYSESFFRDLQVGADVYRPLERNSSFFYIELFDHKKDKQERFNVASKRQYAEIRESMQNNLYETLDIS